MAVLVLVLVLVRVRVRVRVLVQVLVAEVTMNLHALGQLANDSAQQAATGQQRTPGSLHPKLIA